MPLVPFYVLLSYPSRNVAKGLNHRSMAAFYTDLPFSGVFPYSLGTELGDHHLNSFAR